MTFAAVLGPGPGSATQGLAELLAFLHGHISLLPEAGAGAELAKAPVAVLVAVDTIHHAALLAALPKAFGSLADKNWPATLPTGFHRLPLGRCNLTLCVGPVLASVAQWHAVAQKLWVGGDWPRPDDVQALARPLARQAARHAQLQLALTREHISPATWAQAGWNLIEPSGQWCYQPRWPVPEGPPVPERSALVIGAGLAGAAVCTSLARRGWHIQLLESGSGPAQGASGLPVGLLSEHLTAQETVLSRLARTGMALHMRELQRHVPLGQGWQATAVRNLRSQDDSEGGEPSDPESSAATPVTQPAAVVRPAVLVQAWLTQAQAGGQVVTHWDSRVVRLQRHTDSGLWQALDAQGQMLAQAPHAVVAAAHGSAALLDGAAPSAAPGYGAALRPVKGQLSFAPLQGAPLAPHPLRDHGVYVPCFEDSTHPHAPRLWAMGSTYERGQTDPSVTTEAHDRNAASLAGTLPEAHALFQRQRSEGTLCGWAQVRCASLDRLPLVGAVPAAGPLRPSQQLADIPRTPGLWTLSALGSRGLTLSLLGAELLADLMDPAPWPVEKDLAMALDPARFALKRARKKQ